MASKNPTFAGIYSHRPGGRAAAEDAHPRKAQRGQTHTAIAGDNCRDALARLVCHVRFGQKGVVVVGVNVDEAWRNDTVGGVEFDTGLALR